jgi:hypothetical protein
VTEHESKNCQSYASCEAPLCPLDESKEKVVWYPSEPICGARGMAKEHQWIRTQRAIAKKCDKNHHFNLGMLKTIKRVKAGLLGVDPDGYAHRTPENQERDLVKRWLLGRAAASPVGIPSVAVKKTVRPRNSTLPMNPALFPVGDD